MASPSARTGPGRALRWHSRRDGGRHRATDSVPDSSNKAFARDAPEVAARSVGHLIEVTEQELDGKEVMSQIVGHVLLERYGDENLHSQLMSKTRGMLVALAADAAAPAPER